MFLTSEGLRETIGGHLRSRNVLDPDDFVLNRFPNEMMTEIDVLGTSVGNRILRQCEARWPPTRLALSRLDSARLAGLTDISVTWKTTPRATKMRFNVTKFPSRRAPTRLAELTDISVTWQTTPRATKTRF